MRTSTSVKVGYVIAVIKLGEISDLTRRGDKLVEVM
jgi:hypothetical protein